MNDLAQLLVSTRQAEKNIRNQALRFVLGSYLKTPIRRTGQFYEWFHVPMNYARIMELPLTMLYLQAEKDELILDVSSPKLLALYYALKGYTGVVAGDLEDYFINDFKVYKEQLGIPIDTAVFDASTKIPYPNAYFDKIFSISVLEHIPDDGDSSAIREMLRVLKVSGTLVITLPVFSHYVEEWTSSKAYWRSIQNSDGKTFFQRRYDHEALVNRLLTPTGIVSELILIAEKPIEPPRLDTGGKMLHNSYYIDKVRTAQLIKALGRRLRKLPFTTYWAEKVVSKRSHYLTKNWDDPNIRQVVVKITKTA